MSSPYSNPSAQPAATTAKAVTTHELLAMRARGEKIAMLTTYDASFAAAADAAGVDVALVGDSLGMVLQGSKTTLAVTQSDMIYHTRCVAAGVKRALVLTDMAFGTYQETPQQAYAHACELMAAGAQMVKIEGGAWLAPTVEFLVTRGVPVCGHIGLTPQSVHALGGYKVQGRGESAAALLADARALDNAGATLVLMEMVPRALANDITNAIRVPTIGIGAGIDCSGQVLVLHDVLDVFVGKRPRFAKNYMTDGRTIAQALSAYVQEVKTGVFPTPEHSFE